MTLCSFFLIGHASHDMFRVPVSTSSPPSFRKTVNGQRAYLWLMHLFLVAMHLLLLAMHLFLVPRKVNELAEMVKLENRAPSVIDAVAGPRLAGSG